MFKKLVDLGYTDEDEYEMAKACSSPAMADQPKYPWGLRLTLTDKEFAKLAEAGDNFDADDAFIGGEVHGFFMGRIVSVNMNQREGGPTFSIEIQIEQLGIESEDAEDEEAMKGTRK
jgi:hypothetical protein